MASPGCYDYGEFKYGFAYPVFSLPANVPVPAAPPSVPMDSDFTGSKWSDSYGRAAVRLGKEPAPGKHHACPIADQAWQCGAGGTRPSPHLHVAIAAAAGTFLDLISNSVSIGTISRFGLVPRTRASAQSVSIDTGRSSPMIRRVSIDTEHRQAHGRAHVGRCRSTPMCTGPGAHLGVDRHRGGTG